MNKAQERYRSLPPDERAIELASLNKDVQRECDNVPVGVLRLLDMLTFELVGDADRVEVGS